VHIIVDNYATHKHRRVRRWFAARPQFHVHFTYASWLNQVEIWFNRITQQALRRGTFSSVKELAAKIDHYVQNSNRHAQPFFVCMDRHGEVDFRQSRETMRTYSRDSTRVTKLPVTRTHQELSEANFEVAERANRGALVEDSAED
jgi:hypothetical protein